MILYHFTTAKHLAQIKTKGLALGMIPWALLEGKDRFTFVPGWQWLTRDSDWTQDWDDPLLGTAHLPFRRTDVRITIEIPSLYDYRVVRWDAYAAKMKPPSLEFLARYQSARWWFLYHGTIPPSWFLAIENNPNRPDAGHIDAILENN